MIHFILGSVILGVILLMFGAYKDDGRIFGAGSVLLFLASLLSLVR